MNLYEELGQVQYQLELLTFKKDRLMKSINVAKEVQLQMEADAKNVDQAKP